MEFFGSLLYSQDMSQINARQIKKIKRRGGAMPAESDGGGLLKRHEFGDVDNIDNDWVTEVANDRRPLVRKKYLFD